MLQPPHLTLDQRVSPHIEPVIHALAAHGIRGVLETVDYELQKGGNKMLRLMAEGKEGPKEGDKRG